MAGVCQQDALLGALPSQLGICHSAAAAVCSARVYRFADACNFRDLAYLDTQRGLRASCAVVHERGVQSTKQFAHLQMTVEEASSLCRRPWMRGALHDWLRKQGWCDLADELDAASLGESVNEASSLAPSTSL